MVPPRSILSRRARRAPWPRLGRRIAVAALGLSLTMLPLPAMGASDEIRLAGLPPSLVPGASGSMSIVFVRDLSGSPLGGDQPAGSKIQSFSIKVAYSPAAAFSALTLSRAGVLAPLAPKPGEANPSTAGTASYIGSFAESTDLVPFTLDAGAPGDLILQASYAVAPAAPAGTVTFTFDPGITLLANEAGTLDETVADGGLLLFGGTLAIVSNAAQGLYAQPISASAIQLGWGDPNQNETNFRIERSTDGSTWSTVTTVGPNDTTYVDNGRSPATLYYYRLVTLIPADSQISNVASASTFPASAAKVCVQRLPGNDATWARYPSAAWNGVAGEWGLVWQAREDGVQDDIWFQRRDSTTLAPIGSPVNVSQSEMTSLFPRILWNGSHYLVAWYEHERRAPGTMPRGLARFALLNPDGSIVRRGVTPSTSSLVSFLDVDGKTDLSWDGTNWGYLTPEVPTTHPFTDLFYRRLSESGDVVLGPTAITATAGLIESEPDIAFNPTLGLDGMAWIRYVDASAEAFFQRVEESTGAPLGSAQSLGTFAYPYGLSAVADGADGWAVAWGEYPADGSEYAVYLRKVDASGTPVGPAKVRLSDAAPAYNFVPSLHQRPDGGFAVITNGYGPVSGNFEITRLQADSSGAKDGAQVVLSPDDGVSSYLPAVAEDGSRFLVVWNESDPSGGPAGLEVAGLLVDADGLSAPGPKVDLTTGHTPGSTFDRPTPVAIGVQPLGAGFVGLWTDPAHPGEVRGRSWDGSGATLGTFTPLNAATLSGNAALVGVGDTFAVLWRVSTTDLRFARYQADGSLMVGENGISTAGTGALVLGFDGENYVAFIRQGNNFLLRKIDPAGNAVGPETTIAAAGGQTPKLLWIGTGWALLWRGPGNNLYYMLVARDGTVLTAATIAVPRVAPFAVNQFAMAWNGSQLGLAWAQRKNTLDPPNRELYFSRLNLNGTLAFPEVTVVSSAYDDGAQPIFLYWAASAFHLVHAVGDKTGYRDIAIDPADGTVLPGERFWSNREGGGSFAWNGVTLGMLWNENNERAIHFQTGACVEDPSPPPCPSVSIASVDNLVRLSWPAVSDAQSGIWRYQVLRDGVHLAELGAGTTQFDDAGYVNGVTHAYAVLAMNKAYLESQGCSIVNFSTTAGDANGDGAATILDIFYLVSFFYSDGSPPLGDADANGDGVVNPTDVFYLINYFFSGGPPPALGGAPASLARRPEEQAATAALADAPAREPAHKPAPSRMRIGTASIGAGQTAIVPIYLRDRRGTPLGTDRAARDRIQAIALRVVALPAGALQSISVRRAGATAGLAPLFESRPTGPNGAGLIVSFDERRSPLDVGPSATAGAVPIAEIVVTLAPTAVPGSRVELRLDPAATLLGNRAGTISESATNGWLELEDGWLRVGR